MKKQKTLLVIAPGSDNSSGDCCYSLLVAETGEHLASHLCSSSGFAYGDLYGRRQERKDELGKRFGEIEIKFINDTDISEKQLLERNRIWYMKYKASEPQTSQDKPRQSKAP